MARQHPLITDEGRRLVAGWASVEIKDLQNDIVPVEVLERAMYDFMSRGGIVMLGHANVPVGRVVRWEVRKHPETGRNGLWIEVELFSGTQYADAVWEAVKEGKLSGFSISGFGTEEKSREVVIDGRKEVVDIVTGLELTEISLVEVPANQLARIEYVNYLAKSADCEQILSEMPNARELCSWLEGVYSQYGYSSVSEAASDLLGALRGFGTREKSAGGGVGPITTETEGAHFPRYGDRPTLGLEAADALPEEGREEVPEVAEPEQGAVLEQRIEEPVPEREAEGKIPDEGLEAIRRLLVELGEVVARIRELAESLGAGSGEKAEDMR